MLPIRFFARRVPAVQVKPVAPTRPVPLQPADLKAVSGAGPSATWGPNATW